MSLVIKYPLFVYTQSTGVIVGAKSFRNEYDAHTLPSTLEQVKQLTGKSPRFATADRGYRGITMVGDTHIQVPKPFNNKKLSKYRQRKLRYSFKRRAAIEPIISHLKTDHRLGRNFYKGIFGDNINIMLSAAAFNFKRMMNNWKQVFFALLEKFIFFLRKVFLSQTISLSQTEMAF